MKEVYKALNWNTKRSFYQVDRKINNTKKYRNDNEIFNIKMNFCQD